MTDEITIKLQARVVRRALTGRKRVLDGRLGDVEATASTRPALAEALERQLRALALHPRPLYRRLCDGRGLIARVIGADDDGALIYTLDRVHPDGRCTMVKMGLLPGGDPDLQQRVTLVANDRLGYCWKPLQIPRQSPPRAANSKIAAPMRARSRLAKTRPRDKQHATDRVGVATLDSEPAEVEAALRRLIEHEVRHFAECCPEEDRCGR